MSISVEVTKSDKLTSLLEKYKELSKECDMILYKIKMNTPTSKVLKEPDDNEFR